MGYKIEVAGLTDLSQKMDALGESAGSVAATALFEGAGLMRDEILKSAAEIRTAPFKYASTHRGETRLPSPEEKEAVIEAGAGIAKFDKDADGVNTSVGFRNSGYTELGGKQRPVPAIINAINSGTSFMSKQPFVRKAARTGRTKAVKVIKEHIESEQMRIWRECNEKYNRYKTRSNRRG